MRDEHAVGPVRIELTRGDVARQPDVDAVVNAANPALARGSGVAGALHRAAGPGLEREAVPLGPIGAGEAVITGGHGLPNRHVVHVVGPVHGRDEPGAELLARGHREALRLADEAGDASIAFPAISTGIYGYPVDEAAPVALSAVADVARELRTVRRVRFVLWSEADHEAFREALEGLRRERSS